MIIESVNNEKVKYFKKLRESKFIKEYKEFIVEGEHLVNEAIVTGYAKEIIVLNGKSFNTDLCVTYVSDKVLKHISLLNTPQDVMAVCNIKENNNNYGNKIVILDDVQDPGNIGTIIRTCVAFNVTTLCLSKNSVSIYNDKVVRSSQGMLFKLNIIERDISDFIKELKENNIKIIGTDLNGSIRLSEMDKLNNYALILGNEGAGVKKELLNLCDEKVLIEMNNNCESLNVGVSTGIILYEWRN